MRFLRRLLLTSLFSALMAAAWLMHRPAAWEPLQSAEGSGPAPLGVLDQMQQAAIKRSAPFEVTEFRLNDYLRSTSAPALPAPFPDRLTVLPPQLALRDGGAELRLRWDWGGKHLTDLTVQLELQRQKDRFVIEVTDGAYGRLKVPRGLLRPIRGLLESLAEAYAPEIQALFKMNGIKIAQDKLALDPRF